MKYIFNKCKYRLVLALFVLLSCKGKPAFKQTKFSDENLKSLSPSPLKGISSYTIQYNSYGPGYVKLILEDNSVYEGAEISKEAMAPVVQLLQIQEAVFDTAREEITIVDKKRPAFKQIRFSSEGLRTLSKSQLKEILSYTIQYNGYDPGDVKLVLADSSEYIGEAINKEAIASVIQLLQMQEAVFDTARRKITIIEKQH